MIERRKHKRLPIELSLEIKKIYKQDYVVIEDVDTEISVMDISKSGIGFVSKAKLPLDYYRKKTSIQWFPLSIRVSF